MAKYDKMVEEKKKGMKTKVEKIKEACNEIILEKEKITYKLLSEKTGIPQKTLYNNTYKVEIQKWMTVNDDKIFDNEVEVYIKEIEYLKKIINQLKKQNDNLKLEVYRLSKEKN